MFDKFISQYMKKAADPQQNVAEQLYQVEQTAGGVEGVRKKYEVGFKKGGMVCRGQGAARKKKFKVY